jgi:Amt family ammonium transporter
MLATVLGGAALSLVLADPALAQAAAEGTAPAAAPAASRSAAPTPNKGDTTWMLLSSILVLLMIVPGVALFYGGLVRTKNMLSVLSQVFAITAIVILIWAVYGYSLAFTDGGGLNSFIGGFSKAFLAGVTRPPTSRPSPAAWSSPNTPSSPSR